MCIICKWLRGGSNTQKEAARFALAQSKRVSAPNRPDRTIEEPKKKLCIDCRWMRIDNSKIHREYICGHPKVIKGVVDLVTGEAVKVPGQLAQYARMTLCGHDGALWEWDGFALKNNSKIT